MTFGPQLPALTDCRAAQEAVDEAAEYGTDAELEQAIIARNQTECAHVAFMSAHMPEAE